MMSHTFTLISFGEKRHFKTDHCLDMHIRQVFEDLLSFRNVNHWDEMDLENFLAVKGRLVSECTGHDTIPAVLASKKFKTVKKIIVCVYSHSAMALIGCEEILKTVHAAVPTGTEILAGRICDEETYQNSVTVDLIALCTE
jgi:hypothetical protein